MIRIKLIFDVIFLCNNSLIMGNAGSNQPVGHHHTSNTNREHRHVKEYPPPSPGKEGQAFVFDKKPSQKLVFQSSHEEEESYFAKVFLIIFHYIQ